MKGAVRRERLNHVQLPQMANRSAENTSQGFVLCCGCHFSMNECALDSRPLVLRSGSFVALSPPRGISFVYWKIFKFAAWNLQNVILSFIRCYSKTISCSITWLYWKKKLHKKVLPIGLEWNKCVVHIFPNLKLYWFLNCVCLSGSRWWSLNYAELDSTESKS